MDFERVLNDTPEQLSINQNNLKINFLQEQKDNLEGIVNILTLNNQLLRNVTENFKEGQYIEVSTLIQRNKDLENENLKLSGIVSNLKTQIFLTKQILQENENQFKDIIKSYQEKILDLRKGIQLKENALSECEKNLSPDPEFEQIKVTPYNIAIKFQIEIQEYKEVLNSLTAQNKQLQKQLQQLKKNQINLDMQNHQLVRAKDLQHQKFSKKKTNESSASQSTCDQFLTQRNLKNLIKGKVHQNEELKRKTRFLNKKYEEQVGKNNQLISSNQLYQEKISNLTQDLNQNKKIINYLTENFCKKESLNVKFGEKKQGKEENCRKNVNYWKKISVKLDQRISILGYFCEKKKRSKSWDNNTEKEANEKLVQTSKQKKQIVKKEQDASFEGFSIISGSLARGQKKKKQELDQINRVFDDAFLD